MCHAIVSINHAPFIMGEEVDVEYLGMCLGKRAYVVRKLNNPNISEVIFEMFLRMLK